MEKITLEFSNDYNILVNQEDLHTGRVKSKHITIDDLVDILQNISQYGVKKTPVAKTEESNVLYNSPLMYSANGVSIIKNVIYKDGKEKIFLKREKLVSHFCCYDTIYNVHTPSLVFIVNLRDSILTGVSVFAIKDDIIKEDTKLYHYPFSNVYSTGHICFGSNNVKDKEIRDMRSLLTIPAMFLSMPSTHDLHKNVNTYDLQSRSLYSYLEENEFDENKLVEVGQTISSLVKGE